MKLVYCLISFRTIKLTRGDQYGGRAVVRGHVRRLMSLWARVIVLVIGQRCHSGLLRQGARGQLDSVAVEMQRPEELIVFFPRMSESHTVEHLHSV